MKCRKIDNVDLKWDGEGTGWCDAHAVFPSGAHFSWVPHVAEGEQKISLMHIAQEDTFAVW
jgi:hypothetical protein